MKLFNKSFNKVLAALIGLLGFSSCGETMCMYGTPQGDYEISGVVFGDDNEKLNGAMVTTSTGDTVYTTDGKYTIKASKVCIDEVEVKAEKNGYEDQTKEVELKYTGGDKDWYIGKAEAVQDFHLTKAGDEAE